MVLPIGGFMKQINASVTPAQWQTVRDELKSEYNFTLPGDSGAESEHGVTVEWSYNGLLQSLVVKVDSHGLIGGVLAGKVYSGIVKIIDDAKAQGAETA
jgi:hypothetical protein